MKAASTGINQTKTNHDFREGITLFFYIRTISQENETAFGTKFQSRLGISRDWSLYISS